MDRVSSPNYGLVNGKRAFVDENLALGVAGTDFDAVWHNGAQESIVLAVEGVGLVPTDADNTQHLQAIKRLSSSNVLTSTANVALSASNVGVVFINAANNSIACVLPPAAAISGQVNGTTVPTPITLRIVRVDSSANPVVVDAAGADSLAPGAQTSYLMSPGEVMEIISDGVSAWYQISSNMTGRRRQVFYASQSWTVPAWVPHGRASAVGGGGGGAGSSGTAAGGGGGAGGSSTTDMAFTPGQVLPAVVGGQGAAGAAGTSGGNGGTSTFGPLTAPGGTGGQVGSGGPGGQGAGGQINAEGQAGTDGTPAALTLGGNGGSSLFGGGGRAATSAGLVQNGNNGSGAGGGYYTANTPGGTGGAGFVIVEY